jgi:hypothetical protein
MTYTVDHNYLSQILYPDVTIEGGRSVHGATATVHCSASGSLAIRYPGRLRISAHVTYNDVTSAN